MKLLLLSNSTRQGDNYLGWPQEYLSKFLKPDTEVLFVPFAGVTMTYDEYTRKVREALGDRVVGIHTVENKVQAVEQAECIAVGGGNTFQLLNELHTNNLIGAIREAVRKGTPYIGWSAGSVVACPTIMTTNDMPIIQPQNFEALSLTNFQINPHYTEKTVEGHGGESRDFRLLEFLTVHPNTRVVGLPEGNLLSFANGEWRLAGMKSETAWLFEAGTEKIELNKGLVEI